jgi:hypothetical protein
MSDLTNKLAKYPANFKSAKVAGKHVWLLTNIEVARIF